MPDLEVAVDAEPGALTARVRAALASLPVGEARVVDVLLGYGADAIHLTVSEVAKDASVGVGTVIRACQTIGFKGFQAAKIALAQDRRPFAERLQEDIEPGDAPDAVLAKLAVSTEVALRLAPSAVAAADLEAATELIGGADRVLFLAVGTSAPLAQDAAYRLASIGVNASAPPDFHVQHVHARLLKRGDVALVVSHTGATVETIAAASGARAAGADVVAVTSFTTTPLTELATVSLVAGSRETNFRVEAMASRFAHLLLLDSLYISVYLKYPERAKAAQALMADVLAEHRY